MIFWLLHKRGWLWLIPIILILDWLIAPVLIAWEIKLLRDALDIG